MRIDNALRQPKTQNPDRTGEHIERVCAKENSDRRGLVVKGFLAIARSALRSPSAMNRCSSRRRFNQGIIASSAFSRSQHIWYGFAIVDEGGVGEAAGVHLAAGRRVVAALVGNYTSGFNVAFRSLECRTGAPET